MEGEGWGGGDADGDVREKCTCRRAEVELHEGTREERKEEEIEHFRTIANSTEGWDFPSLPQQALPYPGLCKIIMMS